MDLIERKIVDKLVEQMSSQDIFLVIGPRQAGKTVILKQVKHRLDHRGEQTFFLNLEDPDYLRLLNDSPKNLFDIVPIDVQKRRTIVFLDEIQYLNNPSNFLKYFYDEYRETLKLIVSGSSAFYIDEKFTDSLAGRKKIFTVRTLSFREFLEFRGFAHLGERLLSLALSEREQVESLYNEFIVYGGYPRVVLALPSEKKDLLQEIAYSYVKKDVFDSGIRKDDSFYRLMRILASQVGNLINTNEIARTIGVSTRAISHYLYVAQKSFHVTLVRPFFRNLRKELTKMPKVYFSDLGLRNFFIQNFEPIALRNDAGFLLENSVHRELCEQIPTDEVRFWRTTGGREVDFIIGQKRGIEVKYSTSGIRIRDYKEFLSTYPDIPLEFISLDVRSRDVGGHRVIPSWEL